MTKTEILLNVAWSNYGKPYIWGGDSSLEGFDCSGFVIDCLQSIGTLPGNFDTTAQGLYDKFKEEVDEFKSVYTAVAGDLVFYKNRDGKVVHVELCIGSECCIGASGGGSNTNSLEEAIRDNAYIKTKPIANRSGYTILKVSEII